MPTPLESLIVTGTKLWLDSIDPNLVRENRGLGVGYYPEEEFVHVDTRAGEPEIAWSGRDESTRLEYNPRWAVATRPPRAR